jgi:2-hydroxychromene-2-carboxylate isomerase
MARAAERAELDPAAAVAAAYDPLRHDALRGIRAEAEAAGIAGVPSLLAADGRSHWGMGGIERVLAGEPLVPRPVT